MTLFKQGNSVYTFKYKKNTISVYIIYTVYIAIYKYIHFRTYETYPDTNYVCLRTDA